jgi:hypothetical protein
MNRFLRFVRASDSPFDFFSFEYYPFDDVCGDAAPQLLEVPRRLQEMLSSLHDDVPPEIPWLMTEFGYSVFAGRHEVDIENALFHADTVGTFLTAGGSKAYLYGYEPGLSHGRAKVFVGEFDDATDAKRTVKTESTIDLLQCGTHCAGLDATSRCSA